MATTRLAFPRGAARVEARTSARAAAQPPPLLHQRARDSCLPPARARPPPGCPSRPPTAPSSAPTAPPSARPRTARSLFSQTWTERGALRVWHGSYTQPTAAAPCVFRTAVAWQWRCARQPRRLVSGTAWARRMLPCAARLRHDGLSAASHVQAGCTASLFTSLHFSDLKSVYPQRNLRYRPPGVSLRLRKKQRGKRK